MRNLLAVVSLVVVATLSVVAHADETEAPRPTLSQLPTDEIGPAATALVQSINAAVVEFDRYKSGMPQTSPEDSLVFELHMFNLQKRFMDDLHELAVALRQLEESGAQPELREQVETLYRRVSTPLIDFCDEVRGEIDGVRARRTEAAPSGRAGIEDDVLRLTQRHDHVLELAERHYQEMNNLGLQADTPLDAFQELLRARANELAGRIELAIDRIDELEARLQNTPGDADNTLLLQAAQRSLDINTGSMDVALRIMEAQQLDTSAYRTLMVSATRDITAGLLEKGVLQRLWNRSVEQTRAWFGDNATRVLMKILLFLGVLFIFQLLARLVRLAMERMLSGSNISLSQLARRMIVSWTANLVRLLGLLVALSQLGISLGPLLAGLGVAGFVIGFALQDTLGNFAAGVMILMYRPYDVGDLVDIAGAFGTVHKMSLVSTTILTLDNQTLVVPNSQIWGNVIKNITAQDVRRVDMVFGISYSDDIPKAEQILTDILDKHDRVLEEPAKTVKLHTLGESSVDFVVRPWVKSDDYWDVYWDVTRSVKMRFDEEGVSIPFPQRDVHIYQEGGSPQEPPPPSQRSA